MKPIDRVHLKKLISKAATKKVSKQSFFDAVKSFQESTREVDPKEIDEAIVEAVAAAKQAELAELQLKKDSDKKT